MYSFDEVVNSPSSGDVGSSAISGAAAKGKNAATKEGIENKRLSFIIIGRIGAGVKHVKFLIDFQLTTKNFQSAPSINFADAHSPILSRSKSRNVRISEKIAFPDTFRNTDTAVSPVKSPLRKRQDIPASMPARRARLKRATRARFRKTRFAFNFPRKIRA